MSLSDLFIDPTHIGSGGYGFLHLLFLLIAYGFILSRASALISDGSELLLLIPSLAGIVGSVVLPVLGAVPDGAIVLFSGMGSAEEVKEQIAVGVGALAGSTIMLLTIPWALCIYQGRVDIVNGSAVYGKKPKLSEVNKYSLKNAGITPRPSIAVNGKIMLATTLSYFIIQLAAFGSNCAKDAHCKPSHEHWVALVALLVSLAFFIGYLVYNIMYADTEDKEDKVVEVKKKAIESHILSLSSAFETTFKKTTGEEGSEEERRFTDALHTFFHRYDKNDDQVIDAYELRSLLDDLNEDMSEDKFQTFLKEMDTDGSGAISFKEFAVAMKAFIEQKNKHIAEGDYASAEVNENSVSLHSLVLGAEQGKEETLEIKTSSHEKGKEGEEEDDEEEDEIPEDIAKLPPHKQKLRILLRSGWMMGVGTVVVLLFSDPMVDVLNALGHQMNIAPFYVAFVLAPVASNASELIASIAYAKKKSKKTITISLAALEGAACMNNTFCLFIFLCLVFAKNLAWEFSAEVISIIFIEVCLFGFSLLKTHRLYHAIIIISLYPFSIFIVWFFENVVGLN